MPPSIPMVNWVNAVMHGLIALAAAFIAFNLAIVNRMGKIPSAPDRRRRSRFQYFSHVAQLYVFSQIYEEVTGVLIYTAIFICSRRFSVAANRARENGSSRCSAADNDLSGVFCDWLSYTLYAFWLLNRLAAGYLGVETRMTFRNVIGLILVPVAGFLLYLVWRFFAPVRWRDSSESWPRWICLQGHGTNEHRRRARHLRVRRGFRRRNAFSSTIRNCLPLIVGSSLLTLILVSHAFRCARDPGDRRAMFAAGSR